MELGGFKCKDNNCVANGAVRKGLCTCWLDGGSVV